MSDWKLFDSVPTKVDFSGMKDVRRCCGRVVCKYGDIEFDGEIDGEVRFVIRTSFDIARGIMEMAAERMSDPSPKDRP